MTRASRAPCAVRVGVRAVGGRAGSPGAGWRVWARGWSPRGAGQVTGAGLGGAGRGGCPVPGPGARLRLVGSRRSAHRVTGHQDARDARRGQRC